MTTREVAGRPRRVCSACGHIHFIEPRVGVGVLVQDAAGRVLLVRRAVQPARDRWALPAGFVDHDEDPREAAVREALEETRLDVEVTGLIEVYHNPPPHAGASIFILYRARLLGGEPIPADDVSQAGFFALDELPEELAFDSTIDALRRLQGRAVAATNN